MFIMDLVLNSAFNDLSAYQICYTDGPIRFTDKDINPNERYVFDVWWSEILNAYGQKVDYFENLYSLSGHDAFYGEHPMAGYATPKQIVIGVAVSNDSILLSRFGIQATSDFTALIHISGYEAVFGVGKEPKSDDVIRLTEFGSDRPGGRSGAMYQITSRDDEELSQINQLAGHYVWLVRGKRYDFTDEPNIPRETVMDQVYDNSFAGMISGTSLSGVSAEEVKKYDYNVDTDAKNNVFDYAQNGVDTSVYGVYGSN
jgi:hypothetical protein